MVIHLGPRDIEGSTLGVVVAKGSEGRWGEAPYRSDVLKLEEMCRQHKAWLMVREDHGAWHFDPRVSSRDVPPLYVSNTEVLVQLGTLLLLKAPKSFRKVIEGKIVPAYAKALGELRERTPDKALTVLTLRALPSMSFVAAGWTWISLGGRCGTREALKIIPERGVFAANFLDRTLT